MNHIDAIEGTVRSILAGFYQNHIDGTRDDSEYIGNVKLILEGAQRFVAAHPELLTPPDVLRDVLYDHAKQLWREGLGDHQPPRDIPAPADEEPGDYHGYYFDYLYQHGIYPR